VEWYLALAVIGAIWAAWFGLSVWFTHFYRNVRWKRKLFPWMVGLGVASFAILCAFVLRLPVPAVTILAVAAVTLVAVVDLIWGRVCPGCGKYVRVPSLRDASRCPECNAPLNS